VLAASSRSAGGKLIASKACASATSPTSTKGVKLSRKLKVIAACGNGTAGAFAPEALRAWAPK
jgi:phosphomannomutase/phosphoglucomutase